MTTKVIGSVLDNQAARIDVKDGGSLIVNTNDINFVDGNKITCTVTDNSGVADITVGLSSSNVSQFTNDAGYITATLTEEQVQDIAGGMFSGNTESRITATYNDGGGYINLTVDADLDNYSNANSKFLKQGKQTLWIPASAMTPAVTSGAEIGKTETTTNKVNFDTLDFDTGDDEYAWFSVAFPKSWDKSTINFQVFWVCSETSGTVEWNLAGRAFSNSDAIDQSLGTDIAVTDTALSPSGDVMVSPESSNLTIAGSPSDDDLCMFRLHRDVSGDNMASDAQLIGIKIIYSISSENDS